MPSFPMRCYVSGETFNRLMQNQRVCKVCEKVVPRRTMLYDKEMRGLICRSCRTT